ncbi:MAG: roadblock/LC7 domain-containing protein [Methanomicrobiales archaeon]|jgi:predicted regulator of Ras-like GTPase activity (Roadblock/LC7/MglB family)|nr:roadblock/LC7 domain-containing protein [Methanomicrobiales archaeon]
MSVLKEKIDGVIDQIANVLGTQTCALISRDGVLLGKKTVSDFNEAWFAAMCATILASAESVAGIMKAEAPDHVTIQTSDGSIILIRAGEKLLIAAYVDKSAKNEETYEALYAIAEEITENF